MSIILNILHRDFSLLISDTRAFIKGPVIVRCAQRAIHVSGNVMIDGFEKIHLSENGRMAIGITGNTADHGYLQTVKKSDRSGTAMEAISRHAHKSIQLRRRRDLLKRPACDQNEGIVTFFDNRQRTYFTLHYGFSPINNFCRLYAASPDKARLLRAGSGAGLLDRIVGAGPIERFIDTINSTAQLDQCLEQTRHFCEQLSAADESVGNRIASVISTRSEPVFVKNHPTPDPQYSILNAEAL